MLIGTLLMGFFLGFISGDFTEKIAIKNCADNQTTIEAMKNDYVCNYVGKHEIIEEDLNDVLKYPN